ncbi:hypothetical protein A5671_07720 [Mycolicibacter heraklionensis]|nr:hypothetical protein A5671_07720 [Mycolicibacter heraklionensis]
MPDITEVCIVGYCPSWCNPDLFIPGNRCDTGHANVYDNIRIASQHPDVADNICVMNDDFFVTEPVETVETFYRCALADHLDIPRVKRGSWWKDSLVTTQTCLQAHGIAAPLSYELHVPLPVEKAAMAETLQLFQHVTPANPPQWRSLYGNMHNIGGQQRDDVKAYQAGKLNQPYHSTEPRSFPAYRDQLAAMFPAPSRYELDTELAA